MTQDKTFKKGLGLFIKIFSGYIFSALILLAITLTTFFSAEAFTARAHEAENECVPNALLAKQMQLDVVQVQQWLTDISATRGAPGFDDGYSEAEEYAKDFISLVAEFKKFYQNHNDKETLNELDSILTAFNGYYDMGKQMAAAYIEGGPDEGNVFMEKFDPYAEEIVTSVEAFTQKQVERLSKNTHEIRERADFLKNITVAGTIIGLAVMLFLGLFISSKTVGPIKKFTAILRDISEGEGDLTRRIQINSRDEIGDMASYFNSTFEKIHNLVLTVSRQSDLLSEVGVDLSSNMTETASAVNQISANIESIKNQTVHQSASVTETGSTIEQISLGIGKLGNLINEQTANISESSAVIGDLIHNMERVSQTLVENAENIQLLSANSESGRNALDKITTAIDEVSTESKDLMEISAVIQAISTETNLLAMNAAIEAAHAGESGKGFAVVADEVRKLAESSSQQTKTIDEVLNKISGSIETVIKLSNEVVQQFNAIAQGVNLVSSQEDSIRSIMGMQSEKGRQVRASIASLNDITQRVQQSSSEMLEGSRQVTQEAHNMSEITQEITGGMNEMACGAEQINEAVNTVNSLSVQNKNSIDALVSEVKRFKV
ncbi:MAG: methyl-accepting chemotaxis protein [Treponema sp.]|nr:methyl-accepting chemotaxis protein [Treponema sp.]